jgi:hypothetical protein
LGLHENPLAVAFGEGSLVVIEEGFESRKERLGKFTGVALGIGTTGGIGRRKLSGLGFRGGSGGLVLDV